MIIAFCILTGFCVFYYNIPVRESAIEGATDYSWEKNKFYSRATEGFAWGKTNNEGYLNVFDYPKDEGVDILVMGSSHMEAYQVAMDESTAAVLGGLLPDRTVYNIGASGHNFLVCADNLAAAVEKYRPSEYVIIETSGLLFSADQLRSAIDETVPDVSSVADGIVGILQKNQFLRLLYAQLESFNENSDSANINTNSAVNDFEENEALYDELLAKLSDTVTKNGAQLIVVYHPKFKLNKDGSASALNDEKLSVFFADICEKNAVSFLDMSDIFLREYQENHILPHGFANSSVGTGHLNKNGHKMMANALYELIKEEK